MKSQVVTVIGYLVGGYTNPLISHGLFELQCSLSGGANYLTHH